MVGLTGYGHARNKAHTRWIFPGRWILSGHLTHALKFSTVSFFVEIHRPINCKAYPVCLRRYFYLSNMITFYLSQPAHLTGSNNRLRHLFISILPWLTGWSTAWPVSRRNIPLLLWCCIELRRRGSTSIQRNDYGHYNQNLSRRCRWQTIGNYKYTLLSTAEL